MMNVEEIYAKHMITNMRNKKVAKEIFDTFASYFNYDHIFVSQNQVNVYISSEVTRPIFEAGMIETMAYHGWDFAQVEPFRKENDILLMAMFNRRKA